jgi:hypothetical protein
MTSYLLLSSVLSMEIMNGLFCWCHHSIDYYKQAGDELVTLTTAAATADRHPELHKQSIEGSQLH